MGVGCDGGKISKQACYVEEEVPIKRSDPKVEEDPKGFLLGEGTPKKKMHLLNWLTVYMDNKNGSLSIRRLNEEFSVGDLLRKNFPLEASDCKEVWGRREDMMCKGEEETVDHILLHHSKAVKVVDRTAVVTANAETVVVKPPGLQEAINAEIAKYPQGRSFVRPSGTEDIIRVYAEASTQDAADSLGNSVARLVDKFLGFSSSS
ncbi:Phosphoacetylglucosamine mutase [Vitis vinifera]|uniref:Phosphoacetylglucosamine mutase n=1 Tax=Vitis vinifera TaxID=29760 RepID=A0A438IC05_VITVI|nr:Phosphoacetylglucosamine mutase [Vitis vinifera]